MLEKCLHMNVCSCLLFYASYLQKKNPDWKKNKYLKLHVLSFSSIAYMKVYQRIVSVESWGLESLWFGYKNTDCVYTLIFVCYTQKYDQGPAVELVKESCNQELNWSYISRSTMCNFFPANEVWCIVTNARTGDIIKHKKLLSYRINYFPSVLYILQLGRII